MKKNKREGKEFKPISIQLRTGKCQGVRVERLVTM